MKIHNWTNASKLINLCSSIFVISLVLIFHTTFNLIIQNEPDFQTRFISPLRMCAEFTERDYKLRIHIDLSMLTV